MVTEASERFAKLEADGSRLVHDQPRPPRSCRGNRAVVAEIRRLVREHNFLCVTSRRSIMRFSGAEPDRLRAAIRRDRSRKATPAPGRGPARNSSGHRSGLLFSPEPPPARDGSGDTPAATPRPDARRPTPRRGRRVPAASLGRESTPAPARAWDLRGRTRDRPLRRLPGARAWYGAAHRLAAGAPLR